MTWEQDENCEEILERDMVRYRCQKPGEAHGNAGKACHKTGFRANQPQGSPLVSFMTELAMV